MTREIQFRCFADVRSVARTFLQKRLHWELTRLPTLPAAYRPRVKVLTEIAESADKLDDEPKRREVLGVLLENLAEMRESLDRRSFLLQLFDIFECNGAEMPYRRVVLERKLDSDEADSLMADLAVD
jgi:hypothetical protein